MSLEAAIAGLDGRPAGGAGSPSPVGPSAPAVTSTELPVGESAASTATDSAHDVAGARRRPAPPEDLNKPIAATLDVNTATHAELVAVRGIGPATARRILAARTERPFVTIDELVERRIVPAAALERYRPRLVVRARRGRRGPAGRSSSRTSTRTGRTAGRPALTSLPSDASRAPDAALDSRAIDHAG
jgi:competence protein ComEA